MKNLRVVFIILFFSTQIVKSQKINFSLDRPSLQKIDLMESSHGGKLVNFGMQVTFRVSKNYFPNSDSFNLAQPLVYERETQPLKTMVIYYYSIPDSTVRLVEYTCNGTGDKVSQLNKIFEDNAEQFSKGFGNKGTSTSENHEDWTQKTTIWENNVVYIKQFMVTGSYTYRVRVLMSWK